MRGSERHRRLRALHQSVRGTLTSGIPGAEYFNPRYSLNLFAEFAEIRDEVMRAKPKLFGGFPRRAVPTPVAGTDFEAAGYLHRADIEVLAQDVERCAELLGIDLSQPGPETHSDRPPWWEKAWVYKLLSFVLALSLGLQSCAQQHERGDLEVTRSASALRKSQLDRMQDYVEVTSRFAGIKDPDSLLVLRPEISRQVDVINADLNDIEKALSKRERRPPTYYSLPNPAAPARILNLRFRDPSEARSLQPK